MVVLRQDALHHILEIRARKTRRASRYNRRVHICSASNTAIQKKGTIRTVTNDDALHVVLQNLQTPFDIG